MKNIVKGIVVGLVLSFFMGEISWAQADKGKWSLDMLGGVPYTQLTVSTDQASPEYGIGLRYHFNPQLALRLDGFRGIFKSADNTAYGRNFRNEFYRYGLKAEFFFYRSDALLFSLFSGIDGFTSDVTTSISGTGNSQFSGVNQQNTEMMYSFGASARLWLSPYLDFFLQAEEHITGTKLFDGYNSEITSGGDTFIQNDQDSYLSMMGGFTIKFGERNTTHKLWRDAGASDELQRLQGRISILEDKIKAQNKRDDELTAAVARLRDSVASLSSRLGRAKQSYATKIDTLQSRLNEMQTLLAGAKAKKKMEQMKPEGYYYVIAASFSERSNAIEHARTLISRGMEEANVLPPNPQSSYYKVSYTRGLPRSEAASKLRNRYRQINDEAWVVRYEGETVEF